MVDKFPEHIFPRGKRRLYYQSGEFKTGRTVTVIVVLPTSMKEVSMTLKEFGYGLYYFDFRFNDLGDHIGVFFEDGQLVGSNIFTISL